MQIVIETNMMHVVNDLVKMLHVNEKVLSSDGIYFIIDIRKSCLGVIEKIQIYMLGK